MLEDVEVSPAEILAALAGGLIPAFMQGATAQREINGRVKLWARGRAAVVVRYTLPQGPATLGFVAVRVFQCPASRSTEYGLVHQHLAHVGMPLSFVAAKYQDAGLSVRPDLVLPLVVMDWVDGEPLSDFIEKHLDQKDVLRALAATWASAVRDMESRKVAHGDLQPENIFVVSVKGEFAIRLVDYDSVVVPDLVGTKETIFGADGFSHPGRQAYGKRTLHVDVLPALVIYSSLLLIAERRELWERCTHISLLFTRADLADLADPRQDHESDHESANMFREFPHLRPLLDAIQRICETSAATPCRFSAEVPEPPGGSKPPSPDHAPAPTPSGGFPPSALIVTCPACSSRYKLDESKVAAQGAKLRCPKCKHLFVVYRGGATGRLPDAVGESPGPATSPGPSGVIPSPEQPPSAPARESLPPRPQISPDEAPWFTRPSTPLVAPAPAAEEQALLPAKDSPPELGWATCVGCILVPLAIVGLTFGCLHWLMPDYQVEGQSEPSDPLPVDPSPPMEAPVVVAPLAPAPVQPKTMASHTLAPRLAPNDFIVTTTSPEPWSPLSADGKSLICIPGPKPAESGSMDFWSCQDDPSVRWRCQAELVTPGSQKYALSGCVQVPSGLDPEPDVQPAP